MPTSIKHLWPLIIVFVLQGLVIFLFKDNWARYNIDTNVLAAANLLFFLISLGTYAYQYKAIRNKNPNVFIRAVMGGMMVKMVICVIAVFIYISASDGAYNKKAILISMLMYLIFLAAEVMSLMKMNRKQYG